MEQNKLELQTPDDNENLFAINDLNIFEINSLFAAKKKNKDEEDDYDDDDEMQMKKMIIMMMRKKKTKMICLRMNPKKKDDLR